LKLLLRECHHLRAFSDDEQRIWKKGDRLIILLYVSIAGVNPDALDAVFLDFSHDHARQKARFRCGFFPADLPEELTGKTFLEFFQVDKATERPKGIVTMTLRSWRP
jgi:hypothetical protein